MTILRNRVQTAPYIIGSEPQILFYAGLKTPTRVFCFYPLIYPSTLREAFRAEVTDDLRNNMPDILIYVNHPSSHFISPFPTILELFGFSPAEIKDTYYVTLFDRVPERLGFTSGAVFGRFNKPPKWTPLPEDIPAAVMRISRTIAHHGACSCSIPAITV